LKDWVVDVIDPVDFDDGLLSNRVDRPGDVDEGAFVMDFLGDSPLENVLGKMRGPGDRSGSFSRKLVL